MTRRIHYDLADEYYFLKKKVAKLYMKIIATDGQHLTEKRLIKKGRSLIRRMLEIEQQCKDYGLPHPDAKYMDTSKELSQFDLTDIRYNQKNLYNTDGTLFKTPVLTGADLRLYADKERDKFFNNSEE